MTCEPSSLKCTSMRRVNGAGKRNATSASVNARPGLSSGASQASITRLRPRITSGSARNIIGSVCSSGDMPWAMLGLLTGGMNARRRKKNQKYAAPTIAPTRYLGCFSRSRRMRSRLRSDVSRR